MRKMLIILGAMKCGTTSLFQYLSKHPEISPCQFKKEPNFFSFTEEWNKGIKFYDSLWEWQENVHQYALEASVSYTKSHIFPDVIDRMNRTKKTFKFIYIVRDPFDRIESHYSHASVDGWKLKDTSELVAQHAIETTKYYSQIKPYLDVFGKENILILDFQTLKNHPEALMTKVFDFLRIPNNLSEENFESIFNKTSEKRIYRNSEISFIKLNDILSSWGIKPPRVVKEIFKNLISTQVRRYELTDQQKEKIVLELHDDLKALRDKCGINLDGWISYQNFLATNPTLIKNRY